VNASSSVSSQGRTLPILGGILGAQVRFLLFFDGHSTLGIGDLHPSGVMRLIAGVESLDGLVLIGWSASFTYLAMEEYWGSKRADRRAT
jgi:hypothetical protein